MSMIGTKKLMEVELTLEFESWNACTVMYSFD